MDFKKESNSKKLEQQGKEENRKYRTLTGKAHIRMMC